MEQKRNSTVCLTSTSDRAVPSKILKKSLQLEEEKEAVVLILLQPPEPTLPMVRPSLPVGQKILKANDPSQRDL